MCVGARFPPYLTPIATITRQCGRAYHLPPSPIHARRSYPSLFSAFVPTSHLPTYSWSLSSLSFCPLLATNSKALSPKQMGLSFSKRRSNSNHRAALNKAHRDGDAQTYREIQQSIDREKIEQATRSYAATLQPGHPHALHYHQGQAPTINSNTNSNNMIPNNHTYPQPSHHGYGVGYGRMDSQRPAPGRSSTTSCSPQIFQQLIPHQDGPVFRVSPFYQILERIGNIHVCEGTRSPTSSAQLFCS